MSIASLTAQLAKAIAAEIRRELRKETKEPKPKEPKPMTKQGYFIHAVCGLEPQNPDSLWTCYTEFLDLISGVLRTDFNIGTEIVRLRVSDRIPSAYNKKFAHLVKRLSKHGGKLRFRVMKHRRVDGYRVKDAVDLFKRLTDVIFPQTNNIHMFVRKKPQKITVRINGVKKQPYLYTFAWNGLKETVARYDIPRESVVSSLRDQCY